MPRSHSRPRAVRGRGDFPWQATQHTESSRHGPHSGSLSRPACLPFFKWPIAFPRAGAVATSFPLESGNFPAACRQQFRVAPERELARGLPIPSAMKDTNPHRSEDRHRFTFMIRLPEIFRSKLVALRERTGKPMTILVQTALKGLLAAAGLWSKQDEKELEQSQSGPAVE